MTDVLEDARELPPARRRVLISLIKGPDAPTYRELAHDLGVHVGTVYRRLRAVRLSDPELYRRAMRVRSKQLARRHMEALGRDAAHSAEWHRRQASRRFFY